MPSKKEHISSSNLEAKKSRILLYFFLFIYIITLLTVEGIYSVEENGYPITEDQLVIELPENLDRETRSLLIAQRLVANIGVSPGGLGPPGSYGALAQVVYNISREMLVERYGQEIPFEGGQHHLAIISYFMLEDNGAQRFEVIFGGGHAIRFNRSVLDILVSLPLFSRNEHPYDIETTAFLLNEDENGLLSIEAVLIKHHGILTIYDPSVLRMIGNPARLYFVMSDGKNAIYPSVALCRSDQPHGILGGFISFSTDVCDTNEIISLNIGPRSMVGEPGQTINPIPDNPDLAGFPEGSDARRGLGTSAYSSFFD